MRDLPKTHKTLNSIQKLGTKLITNHSFELNTLFFVSTRTVLFRKDIKALKSRFR